MSTKAIRISLISVYGVILLSGIYVGLAMKPHAVLYIIAAVINLALANFVYAEGRGNKINKTFAVLSICSCLWCIQQFALYVVADKILVRYFSNILRVGMLFLPAVFLHFIMTLTKDERKKEKIFLRAAYFCALMFFVLGLFNLLVKEYVKVGWKYSPNLTLLYGLFLGEFVFFMGHGIYLLYHRYISTTSTHERNQLRYLFIGLLGGVFFAFLPNVLLSFGIKIYPLGGLANVIYLGIVAYAIVKHELMDIRIIIRKGIIYTSLTLSLTGIYVVVVGFFNMVLGFTKFTHGSVLTNALAAMIIAISFLPLRNKIQLGVDKIFFRDKYDYHQTLMDLSRGIVSMLDLDKILRLVVDTVTDKMYIAAGSIMLWDSTREKFKIKIAKGLNKEVIDSLDFNKDDYFIKWLDHNNDAVFFREEAEMRYAETDVSKVCSEDKEVKMTLARLRQLHVNISIPLVLRGRLLGCFNLGSKKSDEMFSPEDKKLLTTIANQAAIAIENARLYSEMREMEKSLHQADKMISLGTLASSVAHEIGNPMVTLKTYLQMFEKKRHDENFIVRFQERMNSEMNRLQDILDQLRSYSRVSIGNVQKVNVNDVINDILEIAGYQISKQGVKLTKLYEDNLSSIKADPSHLKQIFMNLILNAVQAMSQGGELKISTKSYGPGQGTDFLEHGYVEISFQDTGCGIPEELLANDKLFKPFFTTKEKGTGLGLSVTKKLIREHNGKIQVQSQVGTGTTFTVKLPLDQAVEKGAELHGMTEK